MRSISPLVAALGGGLVSGSVVAAVMLASGAAGQDEPAAPGAALRQPTPAGVYREVQGRGDGIAFAVPVSAVERLARRPPP